MHISLAHDDDLAAILALQRANLERAVDGDEARAQGFVTVEHTLEILRAMHAMAPSLVARNRVDGAEHVVGYALVMPREARALLPILAPMFARLEALPALTSLRWYVMGQICVAKSHRGRGLVDALYAAHRERYADRYDACVTEIAVRNERSMRAHERVGFRVIDRYRDDTDDWAVVSWRW